MLSRVWQCQIGHVHLEKGVPWEESEEEEAGG